MRFSSGKFNSSLQLCEAEASKYHGKNASLRNQYGIEQAESFFWEHDPMLVGYLKELIQQFFMRGNIFWEKEDVIYVDKSVF